MKKQKRENGKQETLSNTKSKKQKINEAKATLKNKNKIPVVGRIFYGLLATLLVPTGGFIALKGCVSIDNYLSPKNAIFRKKKVYEDLKYYGSDDRYIAFRTDIFPNNLVGHLKVKSSNKPITVGFADNVNETQKRACSDVLNYFNSLFLIINKNVSFSYEDNNNMKDCDVWVVSGDLKDELHVALAQPEFSKIFTNKIKRGTVTLDVDYQDKSYIMWKTFFLHEMMHILLGGDELDQSENSKPFTIMNYEDVNTIHSTLTKLNNDLQKRQPDNKKYEEYTSLMPIDIATLVAVYGNSDKQANVVNYTNLINKTLNECIDIFGHNKAYLNEGNALQYYYESPDNEIQR